MKVTGETPFPKTPLESKKKDDKGNNAGIAANTPAPSELSRDVVNLASQPIGTSKPISRNDALASLTAFIKDISSNRQSADTLHQPLDPKKVARLLQA